MNVWYHLSTIFNQRRTLQIAGLLTLCVALITTLFLGAVSTYAAPGVNKTISFQGRLLNAQGNPVPEGYYNIQFRIYQDGSGDEAGNPNGTLEWSETRINNGDSSGVYVKNGYMSVDLGSVTPFGTSVDWNQDTLWLSMNIAGSSALCTTFGSSPCLADGEMLPMKRLTATPYAINSSQLGGKTADEFLHNGTSEQTGNFNISGTGMANILQGNTSIVAPLFDRADAGTLSIGTTNASTIEIGSTTGNQTINIGTGPGDKLVSIGNSAGASGLVLQGGSNGIAIETGAGFDISNATDDTLLSLDSGGTLTTSGGILSLSDDGLDSAGLYWDETASATHVASSGNTVALQGSGLNLLTAVNDNGQAKIGIGNAASSSYSLDVTGSTNVSGNYAINGVNVLNNTGLTFSGEGDASVNAAEGEALRLTGDGGIKIGDSTATGDPTLLTLDKGETAPAATGDAVLGSMYYDTTLGKVQCYEADGWGSCSSSPDNFITLSPEYTNAVTNGSGIGDMTSDFCSDTLNINDGSSSQPTICGTNETYNFYNWTTDELSAQSKDIYVTYQLPSNFTGFVEGSTSLVGRTNSSDAAVSYRIYKNTASGLVACGSIVSVSTGAQTTWQKVSATGSADPANCNFTASDSLVVKINLSSDHTTEEAHAYVSTLSFAFSND